MAEDPGKQEEKLEFTPEGEALGYISLDQGRVLAMRTAAETPGTYGSSFANKPMAFEVVEAEETEDHYVITLGFRPQGEYAGRPGREQFFIQKEGGVAHRQVLALPRPRRRIPVIPLGIALAAVGVVAIILLFVIPNIGSDNEEPRSVAVMPTDTPEPATATTWARETQVPPPTEHVLPGSPDTQPTATPNVAMPTATSPVNSELRPLESDAGLVNMPANHRGGLEINRNQSVAQSFTVPSDGVVTGAEIVGLSGGGCVDGEGFHFRLLATDQGFPGALIFYEEALSASSVSEQPGIIQITFGLDGWQVGAFESMALELSIDASSTGCAYAWDGDSPGGYRGGQTFISTRDTPAWLPDGRDMGFRVFFTPSEAAGATESTPVHSLVPTAAAVVGPTGSPGARGPAGAAGPAGPQGPTVSDETVKALIANSLIEFANPNAPRGAAGRGGPRGDGGGSGAQGPRGPTLSDTELRRLIQEILAEDPRPLTGRHAVAGTVGPTGSVGTHGAQGPRGRTGPDLSAQTLRRLMGEVLTSSAVEGAPGAIGATGPAGSAGPAGPLPSDEAVKGLIREVLAEFWPDLLAPPGPTGATGPAGATGIAGPTGAVGLLPSIEELREAFIEVTAGNQTAYLESISWGPPGPAGSTGAAGAAGAAGPPGPPGDLPSVAQIKILITRILGQPPIR